MVSTNLSRGVGAVVLVLASGCLDPGLPGDPEATGGRPADPTTAALEGCEVNVARELMIRDLSVVNDPIRTTFSAPASDPRRGAFTFGHLMRQMAATDAQAPDMVETALRTFLQQETVNGFLLPPRPGMASLVLDPWPRINGKLDLERAPMRLLAIVNRRDLAGDATVGFKPEGRFVFGVLGLAGQPLRFNIILEYTLPTSSSFTATDWAHAWHALGALPFPSESHNAALQSLVERFTLRGVMPARPNGSALSQFRTNEIQLDSVVSQWELREFTLNTAGALAPSTIKQTPGDGFPSGPGAMLRPWVFQNAFKLLAGTAVVPVDFNPPGDEPDGGPFPFRAARILNFSNLFWNFEPFPEFSAETNATLRHKLAAITCNGCHNASEVGAPFQQIMNRPIDQQATLSGFLTGITIPDPFSGTPRTFNELERRRTLLHNAVCGP